MTVRFKENGAVVLSTPAGKATGRYFYDGTSRRTSSDHTHENLVLDVIRKGKRERLGFDAEIISTTRLRLYDLSSRPIANTTSRRVEKNVVLKRAGEEDAQLMM